MTSLWVIIRTEDTDPDPEYGPEDPTVCGVYASKEEAIEEILKLYIEDDIILDDSDNQTPEIPESEIPEEFPEEIPESIPEEIPESIPEDNQKPENLEEIPENLSEPVSHHFPPTAESVQEQRRVLLEDELYNTYTNLGNIYTLVECVLGAKHEFDEDVLELYHESLN